MREPGCVIEPRNRRVVETLETGLGLGVHFTQLAVANQIDAVRHSQIKPV